MNCEGGGRVSWLSRVLFTLLLALVFVPAVIIVYVQWQSAFETAVAAQDGLSWYMNIWVRFAFAGCGWLTLMSVAVRASGSITNERDKQTFDTLLTTPLDSGAMLFGKWLGSLLSVRYSIFLMMLIGCVGIITEGLHLAAVPLMIAAWFVYAAFAAALGLWFSAVSRSSMKATVFTIMTLIGLHIGHWLPWMCCGFLMRGGGPDTEHLMKLQAGIMTPPFVLWWLPFCSETLEEHRGGDFARFWVEPTAYCIMGLLAWTLATALLYAMTSMRFRWLTNRTTFLPESDIDWRSLQAGPDKQSLPPAMPWALPVGPVVDAVELPDQGKAGSS